MQQECSCGDSCPPCEKCDLPLCECYCDFDADGDSEKEEDEEEGGGEDAEQELW